MPCNIPLSAVHFLFPCPSPREIKWQVTNVSGVGGDLGHKKGMHTRAWASLPSCRVADAAQEWGSCLAGWAWVRPTAMLSGSSLQQGGLLGPQAPRPLVWLGTKCRYTGSFGWSVNLRGTSTCWGAIATAIQRSQDLPCGSAATHIISKHAPPLERLAQVKVASAQPPKPALS